MTPPANGKQPEGTQTSFPGYERTAPPPTPEPAPPSEGEDAPKESRPARPGRSRRAPEETYTGSERLRKIAVKELARKLLWAVSSTFENTDKQEATRRRLWAEEVADDLVTDALMYSS